MDMFIIDRFEGDMAVIEYEKGKSFNVPRFLLPPKAGEGDVVNITIELDTDTSQEMKQKTEGLMEDLFED
jgi:hypothetical protein